MATAHPRAVFTVVRVAWPRSRDPERGAVAAEEHGPYYQKEGSRL